MPPLRSLCLLLLTFLVMLGGDLKAIGTQNRRVFPSSVASLPPGAVVVERALSSSELAAPLEFEISLQIRNFPRLLDQIAHGTRIFPEEMVREHFPKGSDHEALVRWLDREGFVITGTSENHLAIFAKGSVAQIAKSFQVKMGPVSVGGVNYVAALDAPSLPTGIAGAVLGINGLQPFLKLHKDSIQASAVSTNRPPYLVSDILGAYNATNLGVTGSGQKIAILIDTVPLDSDVTSFWTNNSIPQSLGNLEELNVNGVAQLPAISGEETLDVEWSSGIAPGAKVRVYAAGSLSFSDLDKCLQRLISDLPTQPELHQLSISLGLGETYTSKGQMWTDSQYFATLANSGVSIFVSSGDAGSNPNSTGGTGGPLQVEYFSSDPSVTGVGGSSLTLNTTTGAVSSETGWSGSGGGTSQFFSRPSWQTGAGVPSGAWRLVPDVCSVADPNTGAYVILSGSVRQFGGTSWSAPMWAGFSALINEARQRAGIAPVGLFNPSLYPLIGSASFRDITTGNNGTYSCTAGYDEVTGIGAPNVTNLMQALIGQGSGAPVITGFSPTSSMVPTTVVIGGLNLSNATAVTFNGVNANFIVNSGVQITATVPSSATSGVLAVTTPSGTAISSGTFNVLKSTGTIPLYSIGFETAEGYPVASGSGAASNSVSLSGTKGWSKTGGGGQGLLNGALSTSAQQAFIGFTPPSKGSTDTVLWTPTNYTPVSGDIVHFSVQLNIVDSTNGNQDAFYWSAFNEAGHKLCTVFFNNATNAIGYILESGSTVTYGPGLVNGQTYLLQVDLSFSSNTWSATLDGGAIVTNQPITTTGATLNFGYMAATWHRLGFGNNSWGDNYMIFDNYSVWRSNPTLPFYSVIANSSASNLGSVSGGGSFFSGDTATVTATSGTSAVFVKWLENGAGVSGSSNYTFPVTANRNLVAGFQPLNYSAWTATHFTVSEQSDPSVSGALADPDGDGIVNLIEYASNLDPKNRDSLPSQTGVENGFLTLTYARNKNASDLVFSPEVSSDLINWNSGASYLSSPAILSDDGFTQILKVTDLTPSSSANKRFIRLKVTGQ